MKYFWIALLVFYPLLAWVDDPVIDRFIKKINEFHRQLPVEKVYVHTDKPYYSLGENIWFNAYLFDGSTHEVDTLSKVLYVELIQASEGKLLAQKRLLPEQGTAPGEFYLADTLKEGVYQLRAYTNWMRNSDEAFFFTKEFKVYNPIAGKNSLPGTRASVAFQLFPEGGELVNDIECRVGFKAVDATGKGIKVQGFVIQDGTDTVSAFQSEHAGLGRFLLLPKAGKSYVCVCNVGNETLRIPVPPAKEQGSVLIVDNLSNRETVRAFVFNQYPTTRPAEELILLAHRRGEVLFAGKGSTSKRTFVATIPRSKLVGDGIVHLTLLTTSGEPLAERLIYIQTGQSQLTLQLTPDKTQYQPREKVTLEIEAKDAAGKPVVGNFSLAVTDTKQVKPEPYAETLVSYLLMSSDIKGTIEDPGFYFDSTSENAVLYLDYLMTTQGWRRFKWNQIMVDKVPSPAYLFERGLTLEGKVTRPNKKPVEKKDVNVTLYLTQAQSEPLIALETVDATGAFSFNNLNFADSTRVLLQAVAGKSDRNLSVILHPYPQSTVQMTRTPFQPIEMEEAEFNAYLKQAGETLELRRRLEKARQLKEITVRAKKQESVDSRKIYGRADATVKFDLMNTAGAMSIFQVLQGRVAGLNITGGGMNYTVQIRGAMNFSGVVEPLFLLDGIPMDKESVASINPQDVDYVDVLKGAAAAIYGSRAGGGVISILTKRGGSSYDPAHDIVPGQLVRRMDGYAKIREFYSPAYDTEKPNQPDYRPTVYWNPSIRTNHQGKATVTFWNTDHTTTIQAHLEGTTSSGQVGFARKTVQVQ